MQFLRKFETARICMLKLSENGKEIGLRIVIKKFNYLKSTLRSRERDELIIYISLRKRWRVSFIFSKISKEKCCENQAEVPLNRARCFLVLISI